MTKQPQQGTDTNTPPIQLASPVMPGEEESLLVADDVTVVEEAMHDAIDEDDDPLQYLNISSYDDGGLMAQQYDSGFEHDELMPELPELDRIKADCKKSLFLQSS